MTQASRVGSSDALVQSLRDELEATRRHLEATIGELRTKVGALEAERHDLLDLLAGMRVPTLLLDRELRVARFTADMAEVLDVHEGDEGRFVSELTAKLDITRLVADAAEVLRTHDAKERDVEVDDRPCCYRMRAVPYRRAEGVAGVVMTFVDVSAQKKAEEHRAELAAIVESADEAIWAKSLDGTITSWNRAAERIYGFTGAEMIGSSVSRIVPADRLEELREMHERVARGETVERVETVRTTRDGRRLDVSVSISPVRDRAGRITGASSFSHDVSWRKRAERELVAARDAAESANRAKDQFLAILSHELRTPLTPVLVAAGLLARDTALGPASRAKIELIRRNVELEARLIDDLLDVTSITRGKIELHPKVVSVKELVGHALEVCGAALDAAGVIVVTDVASELCVEVDTARMQQVLWNLLVNAARFSAAGTRVVVHARREGENAVVEVRDEGAGIASDQLLRVFDAFAQAHASPAKRTGGLGLGLAIAKALVEAHGGALRAASPGLGKGSTFTVTLRAVAAGGASVTHASEASRPLCVLLVEDHEDTLDLMRELLAVEGYSVIAARSVAEAVRLGATAPYDVLVSDLGLPDGTGLDVLAALRARRPDVPAIALSGYAMADDRRRSEEAGFSEHLVKPVGFRDLHDAIRRSVGR